MKPSLAAVLLLAAIPAIAHRTDEYLQATLLSLHKDRVTLQLRLTPGIAIYPVVLATIDTDANGSISNAEQSSYADRVLRDLALTIDGDPVRLQLDSSKFPTLEEMKEGLGEIQLELHADLPSGSRNRKLIFKNHHQGPMSAYLVNSLVSSDPSIRITAQTRNVNQSVYELDYIQSGVTWWTSERIFIAAAILLLIARAGIAVRSNFLIRVNLRSSAANIAFPTSPSEFPVDQSSTSISPPLNNLPIPPS